MSERKEPRLGPIEPIDAPNRIPTLTELATAAPAVTDAHVEADLIVQTDESPGESASGETMHAPESTAPTPAPIGDEDIETLADRVLDQLAPVLREAVASAIAELLAERELLSR